LRRPEVRLEQLLGDGRVPRFEVNRVAPAFVVVSAETTVKYAGYLRRQESEIERARKDERRRVPFDFPFHSVPGLSREVVQRLSQVRPDTLAHALRIPGVTPAAVAVLAAYIGRASEPADSGVPVRGAWSSSTTGRDAQVADFADDLPDAS